MRARSSMKAAVREFWLQPAAPDALALLRIVVATIALVQLTQLWPHLLELYGNSGFVQWVVLEASTKSWVPSVAKLALVLHEYGVRASTTVYLVFGVYGLAVVGLLVGWRTRLCALVAWLTHALTSNSGYLSLYGVDTMLHILFVYLWAFPSNGRWSLDARAGRVAPTPMLWRIGMRTLQLHLCLIYLNTGLGKVVGEQWWNGEAIWRAVMQPQFSAFDFSWLAQAPWLPLVAGWGVLLVELGYAVAIWFRPLRQPWLLATAALHLGIAACMKLWLFSLTMIVFNAAAFAWREGRIAEEETAPEPGPGTLAPDAVGT
ncbi:HTTM domain-containing protein [Pyxidicoccus xibeiensis]|uniref:HTTM domain-containing protein n=1 Tax=Pyxidicoccus xibeiensis TaxID=2906759 RepID=UPI0020A7C325|nr:HTTM domain-containing protein [Pyxidicoccus xibeiensis]MCP3141548.1 HTTM domain-containing protein [Pyxidicoccus xibeiensis]